MECAQLPCTVHDASIAIHPEAITCQCIEQLALRRRHGPANGFAKAIREKLQRPARGHRRVQLPHGAGGGVARIDVGLEAGGLLARIQRVEIAALHVHFAANFEHFRCHLLFAQPLRNGANRPHVGGDIFADFAIATRRRHREHTVLVAQTDRQAVELEFRDVFDRRLVVAKAKLAPDPGVEFGGRVRRSIRFRADGKHRHAMPDRREGTRRLAADPLCRRFRRQQFRVGYFQCLEFAIQAIEFGVTDRRGVEDIVRMIVLVDRGAQRCCTARSLGQYRHWK